MNGEGLGNTWGPLLGILSIVAGGLGAAALATAAGAAGAGAGAGLGFGATEALAGPALAGSALGGFGAELAGPAITGAMTVPALDQAITMSPFLEAAPGGLTSDAAMMRSQGGFGGFGEAVPAGSWVPQGVKDFATKTGRTALLMSMLSGNRQEPPPGALQPSAQPLAPAPQRPRGPSASGDMLRNAMATASLLSLANRRR